MSKRLNYWEVQSVVFCCSSPPLGIGAHSFRGDGKQFYCPLKSLPVSVKLGGHGGLSHTFTQHGKIDIYLQVPLSTKGTLRSVLEQ